MEIPVILSQVEGDMVKLMRHVTSVAGAFDFKLVLKVELMKNEDLLSVHYHSRNAKIFVESDFLDILRTQHSELLADVEGKSLEGSGWQLISIDRVFCEFASYEPVRFGCGLLVKVPEKLKNKHAIISAKNHDQKCLLYCILIDKYGATDKNRNYYPSHYEKYISEFNLDGVEFPISLEKLVDFRRNNPEYGFNVFSYDEQRDSVKLEFQTKKGKKRIHLLILEADDGSLHFALIKHLSRLFAQQYSAHHGKIHLCDDCLSVFHSENLLVNHMKVCDDRSLTFPSEGHLQFRNHKATIDVAAVVFFDLETMLLKRNDVSKNGKTTVVHQHDPCGYAYLFKAGGTAQDDPFFKKMRVDFDEEAGFCFLDRLRSDVIAFYDKYLDPVHDSKIQMSDYDMARFIETKKCEFCDAVFTCDSDDVDASDKRVVKNIHHWHQGFVFSKDPDQNKSNYLAALCSPCNLSARQSRYIVATSHNLSFDGSLLMRFFSEIMCFYEGDDVKLCAKGYSNYISFSWWILDNGRRIQVKFIDSLKFNPASLKACAETIDVEQMHDLKEEFPDMYHELARKQTICYAFFSDPDKFKVTEFPGIEHFADDLRNGECCSQEEYNAALKIFNHFKKEKAKTDPAPFTMRDYYEIYLKVDVLLLAAVIQTQRKIVKELYNIDSCHYITLPSMAFDMMLKHTKVKLDYIKDPNIYTYIRRAIRGGITAVNMRYIKPNNEDMGELFDPKKPISELVYYDVNSSYAAALSSHLPEKNFTYIDLSHTRKWQSRYYKKIKKLSKRSPRGYFCEIDVFFPKHTHKDLEDFPPLVQHITVPGSKHKKLVGSLLPQKRFVCHYLMLQALLELKAVVTKIHSVVRFDQSAYIKDFIDENIKQRNAATTKIAKNNYKWINNSVFGKSISREVYRDIYLCGQYSFSGNDRDPDGTVIQSEALKKKNEKGLKRYRTTRYKRCAQFYYSHTPATGTVTELARTDN